MTFRRSDDSSSESIEEKKDRLLKLISESPFHQGKKYEKDCIGKGYRWVFIVSFLKSVDQETGFDLLMRSKYFTEAEKDFILFNIHRLKEISEWSCTQFNSEVKEAQKEDEDV